MLKKLFIDSHFILVLIVLNSVIIFAQECGAHFLWLSIIDLLLTFIFLAEIIYKNIHFGFRTYWKNTLNVMDAILVLASIPSVIDFILPLNMLDLSFLLVLRVLRVMRIFRIVRMFPNFSVIVANFVLALKQSAAFVLSFFILIIIFALIDCSLFREVAPQYFSTPFEAIYSTFRMFSVEGWYEIPDAVVSGLEGDIWRHIVRFYFCMQLFVGGIIGMSLINSIFVDAMVSDNNDELKQDVAEIKAVVEKNDEDMRAELSALQTMVKAIQVPNQASADAPDADLSQNASDPSLASVHQELVQIRALLNQLMQRQA